MTAGALSDVVVVEAATGVAGPYAGRLLSDLGAQVVKVEPPGGDPARAEPPLVGGESAFFNWLNAGKLSVIAGPGDERLARLTSRADIVLHDLRGPAADSFEAGVCAANPRAVVVSLTPYGRSGPRAGWQASELTEWATSGFAYIGGDPAREPLWLPGHQVAFHSGLHAAIAGLVGLWRQRERGRGQRVEIAHQEVMLASHAWLTTIWTHQGVVQRRAGSSFVRCADGFVYLFNLVPYPNLFVLMERFDLLEDEELQSPLTWRERFASVVLPAFAEWAATRTKQEIYHSAQELRVAVSPVNNMADVAASAQLAARDWFGSVAAGGQEFMAPGFPYRLTGTPCTVQGPAPRPGEHSDAVFAEGFAFANAGVRYPDAGAGDALPALDGLRVIEVTANWAGPGAGRNLADLGADVIKVELATKPATRTLVWVANDLWPEHYHRAGYFNKLNRNKRAICLDLSKPAGKAVFLELVKRADVVIENNAARVMGNLGVAYPTLAEANPRIVMCSMSGFGASGPERDYSAYGSNVETLSGTSSLLGYDGEQFFGTGSYYADPVTANHGTVAILAALHARRGSGRGQWIDMALIEAAGPFFAQPFLHYTTTGEVPVPQGNRSQRFVPQDVYPTAGTDCWLALTVRHEGDWQALCGVIGRPDLAADPALATVEGRRTARAAIDAAIRAWAAPLDHIEAAERLQVAGVPAAPVMPNWEIFSDNHLNDRAYFIRHRHPEAGTHWFPGFAWRFAETPARMYRYAPRFAEHNREVFAGLLGMDDAAIAALYEAGVTADAPDYAGGIGL
jgi:crotonobetainyl-CoA:carnitine CoA-transferase CaiB-like acyl-CoA transferase